MVPLNLPVVFWAYMSVVGLANVLAAWVLNSLDRSSITVKLNVPVSVLLLKLAVAK
jgi:hypothetical protein